ncbi:MAG TPA: hypothetical protein VJ785_04220 [Anaerolineales bacterium]|nr:hypothetical protein [Anaerolineales bacterium]
MSESNKVKLSGGPDKSATWIWLENGQLKIEYYDYSEPAQRFFGNDIAYIITVTDMDRLYSTIIKDETSILSWIDQYFQSYFGIKKWLDENGIDYGIEREIWA